MTRRMMPALCLPAVIVLLLVPPPASTNVLPRRNRQTDNLSHRIASAVELYRDTTRTAVIDFSDGLLDWDDVWDTNYGADDFKRYYRVSSLAGGYLIRDHRNRYSETPRNYLEEQIRHITKHYSNAGFWDPSRGFWIGRLDWTPESGWEACPFHFWRFRRLRYIDNEPVAIMNHYVRKELGDRMLDYDLGNVSFYALFEKILNRQMNDSEGLITAIQASPEHARLLKVNVGSALIWYRGITYLSGRIPVEVNYSLFIGDKFQFETRMFKPRSMNIELEQKSVESSYG